MELEVQRGFDNPLLPVDAYRTDHAQIEDLELRLDAPFLIQPAQGGEEGGRVAENTDGDAPIEGAGVKCAHLNAGDIAVVQHTRRVAVGRIVGHPVVAGGRAVDDDVTVLVGTDQLDGFIELYRVHNAHALVVPHMQMDHRCSGLPASIGFLGDLLRRFRNLVAAGGDRARQCYGNDGLCHDSATSQMIVLSFSVF